MNSEPQGRLLTGKLYTQAHTETRLVQGRRGLTRESAARDRPPFMEKADASGALVRDRRPERHGAGVIRTRGKPSSKLWTLPGLVRPACSSLTSTAGQRCDCPLQATRVLPARAGGRG